MKGYNHLVFKHRVKTVVDQSVDWRFAAWGVSVLFMLEPRVIEEPSRSNRRSLSQRECLERRKQELLTARFKVKTIVWTGLSVNNLRLEHKTHIAKRREKGNIITHIAKNLARDKPHIVKSVGTTERDWSPGSKPLFGSLTSESGENPTSWNAETSD